MLTIAHRLNAEGVKPPRVRGWAPSGIREMLYRPLYRGEVVWNRSQKIVKGGTKKQRKRDESEWLTLPAPDLRIISDDLWHRVKERLQRRGAIYARTASGRLVSRPRHRDESAYLLTGFARCGVCGGTIGTDLRAHGSAGSRAHIPHVDDGAWLALDQSQHRHRTLDGLKRLLLRESQAQPVNRGVRGPALDRWRDSVASRQPRREHSQRQTALAGELPARVPACMGRPYLLHADAPGSALTTVGGGLPGSDVGRGAESSPAQAPAHRPD
jgi:Recombinase